MRDTIAKATAIMDAKISFVSLVNKAANKRQFLITKAENGNAQFQTYGAILLSEAKTHFVTGVVYEPMVEDSQKNYMTAEEIAKAEKYFSENSGSIDIQHSFEPAENVSVVESWITKCDCSINGTDVKKGTWLMTVKVNDDALWEKIEKGEITGFSMGGMGKYSDEDVDLDEIIEESDSAVNKADKKSLIVKLANAFGYECVKKGVTENYEKAAKSSNFWTALNALEGSLRRYNSYSGEYDYESDSEIIKSALEEFNDIMTGILSTGNIQKAVIDTQPKGQSKKIKDKPESVSPEDKEAGEDNESDEAEEKNKEKKSKEEVKRMNKSEVLSVTKSVFAEAMQEVFPDAAPADKPVEKDSINVGEMTAEEYRAFLKPIAVEEIKKYAEARGTATNLDTEAEDVEKSEEQEYFLHGIL